MTPAGVIELQENRSKQEFTQEEVSSNCYAQLQQQKIETSGKEKVSMGCFAQLQKQNGETSVKEKITEKGQELTLKENTTKQQKYKESKSEVEKFRQEQMYKSKQEVELYREESEDLCEFPRPESIKILDCTPVKKSMSIQIEDTFWEKKKKLIPDYSVMLKLDEHALQVV